MADKTRCSLRFPILYLLPDPFHLHFEVYTAGSRVKMFPPPSS
jgi:hypothetical protein